MKEDKNLKEILSTGSKALKLLYILLIIILIYVATLLIGEWNILTIIGKIFVIISPLFIGWFIAWLLNPIVKKLIAKGVRKGLSVAITYTAMIIVLGLIVGFTIPSLGTQISEVVGSIPKIVNDINGWSNNFFNKLASSNLENIESIRSVFTLKLDTFANSIETSLPALAVNFVSSLVSGMGVIILSLILGFYILYDFDKVGEMVLNFFPIKARKDVKGLLGRLDDSLSSFVSGTLWLSLLLFVVSIIGFEIIGLKAPILIAFICVITNLIPYIGPYMGAAVAAAIGFAQSTTIGILTLVFILIVQIIDGEILNPIVMSKKLNLNPITIIVSLLIFEYLFGIVGMIIATPCTAILKIIGEYLDEKYDIFGFLDKKE